MSIEIRAVGGYGEVGKNMTAVRIDDEVIICDMGLHMPNYIKYTEEEGEDVVKIRTDELIKVKAVPNPELIDDWKDMVKAIIPTHAHLDHVGAIPYIADRFDAPVICTPYTGAVLRAILKDEKIKIRNEIKVLNPNAFLKISDKITIEFISVTHSTPQTVMVAIHTKHGVILYATDFKFDNNPVIGKKPNYEALEAIGKKGVLVALVDSLYAPEDGKSPSELVAKELLRDVLLGVDSRGKAVIVSTFSSHIARLKSIIEFGNKLHRKIVFLGRSLAKYIDAAAEVNIAHLEKEGEVCRFARQVARKLKEIEKKGPEKYLIIATGHQGEPKSVLSKMTTGVLPFHFENEDHVVFSCKVIPTPINRAYREILEGNLKSKGVRIFKDVHVSGHCYKEDMRDLIKYTKPEHIIPIHSEKHCMDAFTALGLEMGYKEGKTVHQLLNGQSLIL